MDFLRSLFPGRPARAALFVFAGAALLYAVALPLVGGPMLFDLFYHAGQSLRGQWTAGHFDWEALRRSDQNYYKLGPLFTLLVTAPVSALPFRAAHVLWQALNAVAYLVGLWIWLGSLRPVARPAGTAFALLFALLGLFDVAINAQYDQVTGWIAGGLLAAAGLYFRGRPVLAALVLAFFIQMKLVPIVLALLLVLAAGPRFTAALALGTVVFYLLPALLVGWQGNLDLLRGLARVLSADGAYVYGPDEVHHQYGLRAFWQNTWGAPTGHWFQLIPCAAAAAIAFGVLRARAALAPRPAVDAEEDRLRRLLFASATTYILLFNTRTESYSTLHLDAVWWILLLGFREATPGGGRRAASRLAHGLWIGLTVFTLSFSLTDLGRALGVNGVVWRHNLRTPVLAVLFFALLLAWYVPAWRRRLLGGAEPRVPA